MADTSETTQQTYPLPPLSLEEAIAHQFRLVEIMRQHFNGFEALQAGDYGADPVLGRSRYTAKVEAVLSEFFHAEDAVLVQAAGTGAIRASLMANVSSGGSILLHTAPLYHTSSVTLRAMGLKVRTADFNRQDELEAAVREEPDCLLIQHGRQLFNDSYDLGRVIEITKRISPRTLVIVDDNYATMQTPQIGCELGANISTFSLFKLLGPEGVGCCVGTSAQIAAIRDDQYSGGSKVQGPQAMEALRQLIYAPVALAIKARVVQDVVSRLNAGEVPGVTRAYVGSHQEKNLLVELTEPIANAVLEESPNFGATPYPVGSASRYEVLPMFYRLSRSLREASPEKQERLFRIDPFRAGPDSIITILRQSLEAAKNKS